MAIYKRGKTWWVRFTTPSGKIARHAKTTDKLQVQKLHDQMKSDTWHNELIGGVNQNMTWDDAVEKWLHETTHKADHQKDIIKRKWLKNYLTGIPLKNITRDVLCDIADKKAAHASKTTSNRYMALVRAILRKAAFEWDWLDKVPKVRTFKEEARRIRWLTQEEASRLLNELPEHQKYIAQFALAKGLRKANILELSWSQVDLVNQRAWIHPDQAKAKRAIAVPLNGDAVEIISAQQGNIGSLYSPITATPLNRSIQKHGRKH